jgi:SAM-dependent methyltransferase
MSTDTKVVKNWFSQGGQAYARFRPDYPVELAQFLAGIAPTRNCAVDVGCGNGQLTVQLAACFDEVIGVDPSTDQIASAAAHPRVRYVCAPAEKLPLPSRCASLITAAQAAHWFDLPAFYAQAREIAAEGAVIALISYGVLQLPGELKDRFSHFYHEEIGPYWPPERKLVDGGYRDLGFPFPERDVPKMEIQRTWELADFLGYLSTWSAVQRLNTAGQGKILSDFIREISQLWGDPLQQHPVSWPINMRVGTLNV